MAAKHCGPSALAGATGTADLGIAELRSWSDSTSPDATTQPDALVRLCRQRQVETICRVPRLVAELLDEIGRRHGIPDDVYRRLAQYAALDADLLRAVGGDRWAPSPIWVAPR